MKLPTESDATYRTMRGLEYPINVARNIAMEAASTHWIFPADMELYPSPGLVPAFMDLISKVHQTW